MCTSMGNTKNMLEQIYTKLGNSRLELVKRVLRGLFTIKILRTGASLS